MPKFADRVYEQTRTTGTANAVLQGRVLGYQSFAAGCGVASECYYVIAHPTLTEWEVGLSAGVTLVAGKYVLARTEVLKSSNADELVDFSPGLKDVRNAMPAELALLIDSLGDMILKDGSVDFTADQSMGDHRLTDVADPVDDQDADTKAARDAAIADALEGFDGGGIAAIDPARTDAVLVCATEDGDEARATGVTIYEEANDKLGFLASFGAFEEAVDGATVTFDFDESDQWEVTLGGNRTLAFTHASVGQVVKILRYQDGTGDRTPTWWSNIEWNHGLAPVEDPRPGGWSLTVLECVGLTDVYNIPMWKEVCRSTSAPRKSIVAITEASPSVADFRVSPQRSLTLTADRNVSMTPTHVGQFVSLSVIYTGAYSPTFTDDVRWPSDTEPTYTATSGRRDEFCFRCVNLTGPVWQCLGMSLDLET